MLFRSNAARNVERMVNLISDLDEITKLESGEQPLYKENFIIQDLIKDVFESLSIKAAARNIKCSIKKGCEQPLYVFADKEKILRVLINLVENATKYGRTDGSIIASIYKTDERHVLIEISDDGIGIAEEHLMRVFERFYRTDRGRPLAFATKLDIALFAQRLGGFAGGFEPFAGIKLFRVFK